MSKANAFRAIENQDKDVLLEQAVIEGFVKTKRRQILVESILKAGTEFQVDLVVAVTNRAFVVVPLAAQLLPEPAIAKIDAFVVRGIDLAGPEQADVAMGKGMLRGHKAKGHVDVMRWTQLESRPAFQVKGGSGRLMKLRDGVRDCLECHG